MITKEKLNELRERMIKHKVSSDGKAIVELTARELQELIEVAEATLK